VFSVHTRVDTVQIDGPAFRGLILQARTLAGSSRQRVGQFVQPLPAGTQFMECDELLLLRGWCST
jgi:hypothetical protein